MTEKLFTGMLNKNQNKKTHKNIGKTKALITTQLICNFFAYAKRFSNKGTDYPTADLQVFSYMQKAGFLMTPPFRAVIRGGDITWSYEELNF